MGAVALRAKRNFAFASSKWYIWTAPMNKTIYLRDEEGPIWERARELAADKLSPVIVDALKRFIVEKEAEAKGFERIQVQFFDAADHGLPKAKAFYGKWIFSDTKPLASLDIPTRHYYAVALTAKGAAVFYTWDDGPGGDSNRRFEVFSSLHAAAATQIRLNWAALKAMEKLGVPVEELDI